MYVDPYERFVHKPVERIAPIAPVVPRERVQGTIAQSAAPPEQSKVVRSRPPRIKKKRKGNPGPERRAAWPRLAEIYLANPTLSLSILGLKLKMHHTSVYYALKTMGVYVKRNDPAHVAKRLYFRTIPGHVSKKEAQRARTEARIAAGKHAHPVAKLDPERVRAIRHMAAEGISISRLGRKFHLNPSSIRKVVARETWKWVE